MFKNKDLAILIYVKNLNKIIKILKYNFYNNFSLKIQFYNNSFNKFNFITIGFS